LFFQLLCLKVWAVAGCSRDECSGGPLFLSFFFSSPLV
jgi:hypothetical protein